MTGKQRSSAESIVREIKRQTRRMLDTGRAQREFGFLAQTPFKDGRRKAIDWFKKTRLE